MKLLFLLFVLLPIAEIMVLIEVGSQIGTLNTAGLVVLTALVGSLMLRQQGFSTLFRARERINSGALPLQEMMEGLCLAVGGALLVTPGFITDAIGFICLLPSSRRWLVQRVVKQLLASPDFTVHGSAKQQRFYSDEVFRTGDTIEGEYQVDDRDNKKPADDKRLK